LLFSSNISFAATSHTPGKIPIIRINAEGLAPFDIGLEMGYQTKALFADIEHRYDTHLAASISQVAFNDMLQDRLPKLISNVDKAYQKELEGVANAWSLTHDNKLGDGFLSWDEYWLLNLLPDIGSPANGTGFGVLGKVSEENDPIIGRNLDWNSTPQLRSLQTITVYQYAERAVINIGFAGIISVLTGFNESGLFLAHFNAAPYSPYRNTHRVTDDVQANVFELRKALETMTSTRQATRYLSRNVYGISNNILMADKKNIQVLEYPTGGAPRVRHWDSLTRADKRWERRLQIAVVDCHVLATMPNDCIRAKDAYRWERLRTLAVFSGSEKAGVRDISRIMLDSANKYYEILSSQTLQSMVYQPASGHLYLYTAPVNNTYAVSPSYEVYYLDLLPLEVRKAWDKARFNISWLAGLLLLIILALVLWFIRKSVKKHRKI
jgi:hypothetical protein